MHFGFESAPGENAVGAGDGLHQRVVAHRLVEIYRRAARRIKASQPHGADEDQAQRVFGVLELLFEARLRLVHPPAVRRSERGGPISPVMRDDRVRLRLIRV